MDGADSRPSWTAAAWAGAHFGFAYGLIETLLLIWEPWVRLPAHVYGQRHAGFAVAVVLVHAAVVAGAAVAAWAVVGRLPASTERTVNLAGLAGLAGTCALGVVMLWPQRLLDWFTIPFAAAVLAGGAAGCFEWGRRLRWLHRPALGAATIFLPTWVISVKFADASWAERMGGAAAACAALWMLGAAADRRWGPAETGGSGSALRWGAAAVALSAATSLVAQQPKRNPVVLGPVSGDRPNVLMIVLDTVRADHTSLYGYERDTTPNLKRFAEQATLFTRSYSSGDMTLISHASLFSGQRADVHGAHFGPGGEPPPPLSAETETLAELLADQGYRTAAVAANHAFFNDQFGLDQGFETFDYRYPVPPLAHSPNFTLREAVRTAVKGWFPARWSEQYARLAEPITDAAAERLREFSSDERPFFLFVNYMDAHWPYVPPPPYEDLYPGRMDGFDTRRYWELFRLTISGEAQPSAAELAHLKSQYDGAIAFLDEKVRELLDELQALGLDENTLIVVTSDHGEDFGEHGLYNHGVSVRQSQIQVPLVIKTPGQTLGAVAGQAVNSADVFATVLDAVGLPPPPGVQGEPQLAGEPDLRRRAISHSYPSFLAPVHNPDFYRIQTAVLSGPFKLIHSTKASPELYDLESDPGEDRNLYDPAHPVVGVLADALPDADLEGEAAGEKRELTPEAVDRLRSLGYLD